jgi:hypothetical protein
LLKPAPSSLLWDKEYFPAIYQKGWGKSIFSPNILLLERKDDIPLAHSIFFINIGASRVFLEIFGSPYLSKQSFSPFIEIQAKHPPAPGPGGRSID